MAFRRCESPMTTAVFNLSGIKKGFIYEFEGDGEKFEISGDKLIENGLTVNIAEKRESRLYFYKVKL